MVIALSADFAKAWAYVVAAGVLIGIVAGIDALVKRKEEIPAESDQHDEADEGN